MHLPPILPRPTESYSSALSPLFGVSINESAKEWSPPGGAGASGENAVAVVQFNRQEWMVELVSQPGRMYQVKKGAIPQTSTEALWGQTRSFPSGAAAEKSRIPSQSKKASNSAYPTMPSQEGEVRTSTC